MNSKSKLFSRLKKVLGIRDIITLDESLLERKKEVGFDALLARAREAEALLKNNILFEVLNSIKTEVLKTWKATEADQSGEREFCYLTYRVVELIETKIKMVIDEAQYHIKREERKIKEKGHV